jgi:uracil-DNA glycosylase
LHHVVFPKTSDIIKALEICPLEETKVVILGQDPYHGAGQAHGLSFSVPASCQIPPSLRNIYKELERSLNLSSPHHGDLSEWARQGVLLLNTSLTVRSGMAGSHSKLGWSQFTDTVIRKVSDYQDHVVFLLWGSHAQSKSHLIDPTKHLILQSAHPSPLSAHRGFIGNNHFLMSNEFLKTHQLPAISWELLNSQIELFDS